MKDAKLPIAYHLAELRRRVIWSAVAVVVCTAVAFVFHEQIIQLLLQPARGFGNVPNEKPIYTDLTEFIGIAFKVSLLTGIVLSLPFVLFQIVMFVSPGLNGREKRYLYYLVPVSLFAFLSGAAFGYFILFPPAVNFLLTFGSDLATPFIRIGNYVNLMITLLFWMGLVFETPAILFLLSKIGVVTPSFLSNNRRWAIVIAFILGALITPTFDPINQSLVAFPIIVLYEVGIWLAKIGYRTLSANTEELEIDHPSK